MSMQRNPHAEKSWPYNIQSIDYRIARIIEAAHGAHVLANLLQRDFELRQDREDDDDPESLPLPLGNFVVGGLHNALNACLSHLASIGDQVMDSTRKEVA